MLSGGDKLLDGSPFNFAFDGVSSIDGDVVVREVISQVEYCLDKYNLSAQLPNEDIGQHIEVEGRLGVCLDSFSNERLKLPIESEALLYESSNAFPYRFGSSISSYHFECFCRQLLRELGLGDPDGDQPEAERPKAVAREVLMETQDIFLPFHDGSDNPGGKDDDSKARISLDPSTKQVIEAIRKEPLVKLNVYSGRDAHEDEVELLLNEGGEDIADELRTAVDFRISVNKEIKLEPALWSRLINQDYRRGETFTRRRSRKSYPLFGAFRVDCTVVQSSGGGRFGGSSSGNQSHEIELEINPYLLYHHHLKKQTGDASNKFDVIIANFVEILRCWTAFLNTNGSSELLTSKRDASSKKTQSEAAFGADLRPAAVSDLLLETYLNNFSPVVPLIGDYAFRFVAPLHCPLLPAEKRLNEQSRADSMRLHLSEAEMEQLQQKRQKRMLSVVQ